jgi:bacillithiol system protein YtxJ
VTPTAALVTLRDMTHLDELLADSGRVPVLVFKHSTSCGTSFEARDELLTHVSRASDGIRYLEVTVQDDRGLSNAVTERLGVRHQTPQAILVRDGEAVWTASHFRVTAAAVARAVSDLGPQEPAQD